MIRCEGYRKYGSFMTLGPREWKQCKNEAVVVLKVRQEEISEFPACMECWREAVERKMEILEVMPLELKTDR